MRDPERAGRHAAGQKVIDDGANRLLARRARGDEQHVIEVGRFLVGEVREVAIRLGGDPRRRLGPPVPLEKEEEVADSAPTIQSGSSTSLWGDTAGHALWLEVEIAARLGRSDSTTAVRRRRCEALSGGVSCGARCGVSYGAGPRNSEPSSTCVRTVPRIDSSSTPPTTQSGSGRPTCFHIVHDLEANGFFGDLAAACVPLREAGLDRWVGEEDCRRRYRAQLAPGRVGSPSHTDAVPRAMGRTSDEVAGHPPGRI